MLRTIELAALPSTLQLCLQTADRCGGLVKSLSSGVYVGINYHPLEATAEHAAVDLISLLAKGLLVCSATPDSLILITDAGTELLNTGYFRSEVTA